jgi:hypothetical protein
MNVLIFASSYRSYTALQNVYTELVHNGVPTFFLYSTETDVNHPMMNMGNFNYDTNVDTDFSSGHFMRSIGLNVPFKPDVVLLARERWQPEQSIILESKSIGSKVYVVEVSSHIINNIENRLEMLSRDSVMPQSLVDGYFEHSEFARQRRSDCLYPEWINKSMVVGNPRFDLLRDIDEERCIKKYNIDKNKKQILFWGIINTSRNKSFEFLRNLYEKVKDTHQIFYKPNPQEPSNPVFSHQFNPFVIPEIQVIYDDIDTNTMSNLCDIHMASISSVCQYSFYFNKKLCILNDVCQIDLMTNDYSRYTNESKEGVEDSALFWMSVFGVRSYEEFSKMIDLNRVSKFNETNNLVNQIAKNNVTMCDSNFEFLNDMSEPNPSFIKLFDEFNDKSASQRIVNYLLTLQANK